MIDFLGGIIAGLILGFVASFQAFNAITKRMAKQILEENDKCRQ